MKEIVVVNAKIKLWVPYVYRTEMYLSFQLWYQRSELTEIKGKKRRSILAMIQSYKVIRNKMKQAMGWNKIGDLGSSMNQDLTNILLCQTMCW
jgi:hypothetical protein